jgi:hypothetical protein
MSLPFRHFAEPPPVPACETDEHDSSRNDLDGVMRQWLSSIRPSYRRQVSGRSTLQRKPPAPVRGRHRAR